MEERTRGRRWQEGIQAFRKIRAAYGSFPERLARSFSPLLIGKARFSLLQGRRDGRLRAVSAPGSPRQRAPLDKAKENSNKGSGIAERRERGRGFPG